MKIDFEFITSYGVYRDALHLDDNHTLSSEEIENLKLERLNNWIYVIENPPTPIEEDFIEIDGVLYQKVV